MDEGDEYVPQISQMDYQNLMDVGSGGGYYDQMQAQPYGGNPANEAPYQHQQRMQAAMSMQQNQMISPHMQMGNPSAYMAAGMAQQQMHNSRIAPQQPAPSQPAKPKSTRKSKKAAAAAANAEAHPPAQQSLPASYQIMPPAGQQPNVNPMMQAQQQQQQRMNLNPYVYMQQQQARWPAGEQVYGTAMPVQPPGSYPRPVQPQQQPPANNFATPGQYQVPGMPPNAVAQAQQNSYYQPGASQIKPSYYGQQPGYPMPYGSNPQVQSAQQARTGHPQPAQYAGQPQQQQSGPYFSDPNNPGAPSYYPQPYPAQGYAPPAQTGQPTKMNTQQQPIQSQHSPHPSKTSTSNSTPNMPISPHYTAQSTAQGQMNLNTSWPGYNPPLAGAISPGYFQGQPPQSGYPPAAQIQQQYHQIQHEMMECERQLQMYYQQPQRTPEMAQRMEQMQQKFNYLRSRLVQLQQQSAATSNQFMSPGQQHQQPPNQILPYNSGQQAQANQKYGNSSGSGGPQISPGIRPMPAGGQQMIGGGTSGEKNDTPTSVSVHHGNQVQVNITPEPTGRTLISVYHGGYPTPSTITSTANSNQQSTEFSTFYKDSIPPEPLPPKFNVEAQQQLHSSGGRMPGTPVHIKPELPKNASTTLNASFMAKSTVSSPSVISTSIATSTTCFSSFTTIATRASAVPVLDDVMRPEELIEVEPAAPAVLFKDEERELLGHKIEKMDNCQSQTHSLASIYNEGYDPFKKSNSVVTVDPPRELSSLQKVNSVIEEPQKDEESAEILIGEPEKKDFLVEEAVAQSVTEGTDNFNKSMVAVDEELEIEKPVNKKQKISPSSTKTKSKKSSIDHSTLNAQMKEAVEIKFDAFEESLVEKKVKAAPKPVAAAKKKTVSVAHTNRKRPRKQTTATESDWDDMDDSADQDFVVSKKKKGAKMPKVVEPKIEVPEAIVDLDGFVEKRRSSRKKAEKTYGDREISFDMDDDDEDSASHATSSRQLINEPVQKEWIVEKILGIRTVKRKIKKRKPLPAPPSEESTDPKVEEAAQPSTNGVCNSAIEENNSTSKVNSELVQTPELASPPIVSNGTCQDTEETAQSGLEGRVSIPIKVEKAKEIEEDVEEKEVDAEELYVKYKGRSYMHCEWKLLEELEIHDKRVASKYNRHKLKFGENIYIEDEEYFNEDYLVVDRVLDETYDEEEKENYAFVKWRSLAYDECTWELFKDVPECKIEEFRRRNNVVDTFKMKERARPSPSEWTQIPLDVVYKDDNTLRDYQVEGVNWLLFCYFNKQNCILADEMGLGKTVQTITFLEGIYEKGIHGPFLIVVPLSTLHNWEREFETWTDMNAVVYHGSAASRQIIQNYEMYYAKHKPDGKKKHIIYKFDALITTFETVVSDCEVLRKINYRVCVIDEAHRLKNRNCKLLTGGLLSFKMEHRVLLTGTPLQNNIQELFSLLNFLEPEQFCSSDTFLEQFGQCQTEEQVQKLQDILKPMMLRRLKEDVEKTLQPKEETIIEVQLSNIQKKYYRAILERNFTHLLKGSSQPSLMNTMMELRKCCNHPFLINGAEEQILSEMKLMHPEKTDEELLLHGLIQSSGKLVLIDKLLPKLRQDGHKVLVFSQMVRVLDILEEFLHNMNYPFERIDGNVRGDMRQAAIDRFCKPDSERFVFLLCTRAGGLGINLTAADTVIIFDSDWNPQNDLQAQARCHRIGQTKMVKVYRLITTNTYEREMFDKASLKLGLDKAVLQSSSLGKENSSTQLTRKEVEDLLRKGAYGAVMEEDTEGSKFSEEDIETILQRRTQTIKLEPGIKGSTFAKASFKSSTNREDIDVNDPNFWAKWAKKANIDVDAAIGAEKEHLIMAHPRSRRKRFEENQYKASESGEEVDGSSDTEGGSNTGKPANTVSSRILEAKNRSGKKRRRTGFTEEDEDYINYTPNELAFNKSEFFKVEKLLGVWGWGRWKTIKDRADIGLSENDMEHISRTFLLHCVREFRGDEKTRDFVWRLIIPKGAVVTKPAKKSTSISGGIFHEGWAALPEYNPPAFAVDLSFQRHIHRHANKLLQRICHIQFLHKHVIGEKAAEVIEEDGSISDVKLELPMIGDPPIANWDLHCDKSFLIGIFKHGMENYEAIRADAKLCFIEKKIEEMPSNLELNSRFKRLIVVLQRQAELSAVKVSRWPKQEEIEFMRILRTYGVKDDSNSANVINWARFRELSSCLQKKSDAEMLEQLYCVLAMCTKQQGGELSTVDHKRAECVEAISGKRAEKLMNRLHLMRKIHAIITTGIHNVRTSLKLCATDVMPKGWAETHDEHLLIAVDKYGLDDIVPRLVQMPQFDKMSGLEEKILLRRVVEICTTLETGKWNGVASIEMIEDGEELNSKKAATISSRSSSGRSTPMTTGRKSNTNSSRNRVTMLSSRKGKASASSSPADKGTGTATAQITTGGHLDLGEMEKEKMRNLMHQSFLQKMEQAATSMNPSYMLSLLGLGGTSPSTSKSSQLSCANMQQIQQMQALLAMSSFGGLNLSALASVATPAKSSSEDALNLSKRAKTSTPKASSSGASLSSGLSHSAMKQLSQLSISDLLAMSNFGQETHIPVAHIETGARLSGDKAPKLKNLDQWLTGHPNYSIDVAALAVIQPNTSLSSSLSSSTAALKTSKEASKSSSPITNKSSTPTLNPKPSCNSQKNVQPKNSTALEPGEIPKINSKTAGESSLENSVLVGVFHKSTGIALPTDKWPTLANLPSWLDKNKECNVQNTYASIVKSLLPKSYHDRLGGDYIAPTVSTPSNSVANLSQSMSAAALTQLLTNPIGTSTSSAMLNPLLSTSTSSSATSNAMSLQNMEALQMQMLLQQIMLGPSLMGQGASGYNPYATLMAGSSGNHGLTESALAAALMGVTDAGGLTAGMPSAKAVSSSSSNAIATNSQTNTPSSSSVNNNNMAASLLAAVANEAALTAEIMANPTLLATMLSPMTTMSQSQPFGNLSGLDAASTAQLNAALAALGAGNSLGTAEQQNTSSSSGRSSAAQPAPASSNSSSKKSTANKGRLNAVLEKLSSGNNPSPNPT